jgi:L-threonylcarbamoyladenylate synthase
MRWIMNTEILRIHDAELERDKIKRAADILRFGGLAAFPTETVYGLGGNGLDASASEKIYRAKGRPSDNPLILHISKEEELYPLVSEVPETARKLMAAFWPGPMTLIFKKSNIIPYETTGGLDTVAVRMPNHPIAATLIEEAGFPLAAPSANASGRPSPTTAAHVYEDLAGSIDMILDGGDVGIGLESTIIDITSCNPVILRPGYFSRDMLGQALGEVIVESNPEAVNCCGQPKAPGMKYKHYAPKAPLTIVRGSSDNTASKINELVKLCEQHRGRAGIICTEETRHKYHFGVIKCIGSRDCEDIIAYNLYRILREFDSENVACIYSEAFDGEGLRHAIMNRLIKAAGYNVLEV